MPKKDLDALLNPPDYISEMEEGAFEDEILTELRNMPNCLLYTSPSPRDATLSRMPSSA